MNLKVGDKILILEDLHNCAGVWAGDILAVGGVYDDCLSADGWWFEMCDEGTGWELYEKAGA